MLYMIYAIEWGMNWQSSALAEHLQKRNSGYELTWFQQLANCCCKCDSYCSFFLSVQIHIIYRIPGIQRYLTGSIYNLFLPSNNVVFSVLVVLCQAKLSIRAARDVLISNYSAQRHLADWLIKPPAYILQTVQPITIYFFLDFYNAISILTCYIWFGLKKSLYIDLCNVEYEKRKWIFKFFDFMLTFRSLRAFSKHKNI